MRNRLPAVNEFGSSQPLLDDLALRITRLVRHRGFDHSRVESPLLKRVLPVRKQTGAGPMAFDEARARLEAQKLDRSTVVYLVHAVEAEVDEARLRIS